MPVSASGPINKTSDLDALRAVVRLNERKATLTAELAALPRGGVLELLGSGKADLRTLERRAELADELDRVGTELVAKRVALAAQGLSTGACACSHLQLSHASAGYCLECSCERYTEAP